MGDHFVENFLEAGLFRSRWLLAPFYVGLLFALIMLLVAFGGELVHTLPHMFQLDVEQIILSVLTLIDLSLAANLVLIVVLSGYENFVSKIDTHGSEDRPSWMGMLDFSGLKMKLIGSIVAISAISLLRAFMSVLEPEEPLNERRLLWLVILHLTFLASGVLFALMDWLGGIAERNARAHE
ncbi:MAG TPA: TIGR00645 family protein [Rhizomicrobium sp.]